MIYRARERENKKSEAIFFWYICKYTGNELSVRMRKVKVLRDWRNGQKNFHWYSFDWWNNAPLNKDRFDCVMNSIFQIVFQRSNFNDRVDLERYVVDVMKSQTVSSSLISALYKKGINILIRHCSYSIVIHWL